ncbi:MAG: hypothetical protein NVSMB64_16140 [Candidatus Velthaea sp.]
MQTDSVENIFARAWSLLTKNPVILLPGIVVGIAVGIVQFFVVPPLDYSGDLSTLNVAGRAFGALIMLGVGVLAYLVTQGYTVGMAGAAWQKGTADLGDGAAAFQQDAGRLLGALLLLAAIGIVVAVLTFGIGWLIFLFFAIYTVPAVVLSNLSPTSALSQSFSISTKRFVPTLIIIALLFVIGLVAGVITLPLHFIPLLGPILGAIITQAIVAYSTLVVVGEYLSARNAPDITTRVV